MKLLINNIIYTLVQWDVALCVTKGVGMEINSHVFLKRYKHCPKHKYWFTGIRNIRLEHICGEDIIIHWIENGKEKGSWILGFDIYKDSKKITQEEYEEGLGVM